MIAYNSLFIVNILSYFYFIWYYLYTVSVCLAAWSCGRSDCGMAMETKMILLPHDVELNYIEILAFHLLCQFGII